MASDDGESAEANTPTLSASLLELSTGRLDLPEGPPNPIPEQPNPIPEQLSVDPAAVPYDWDNSKLLLFESGCKFVLVATSLLVQGSTFVYSDSGDYPTKAGGLRILAIVLASLVLASCLARWCCRMKLGGWIDLAIAFAMVLTVCLNTDSVGLCGAARGWLTVATCVLCSLKAFTAQLLAGVRDTIWGRRLEFIQLSAPLFMPHKILLAAIVVINLVASATALLVLTSEACCVRCGP